MLIFEIRTILKYVTNIFKVPCKKNYQKSENWKSKKQFYKETKNASYFNYNILKMSSKYFFGIQIPPLGIVFEGVSFLYFFV